MFQFHIPIGRIILLWILSGFFVECYSQSLSELVLNQRGSRKFHKVEEGRIVKVILGDQIFKGRLEILNDSTIKVGSKSMLISHIDHFFISKSSRILLGAFLASAGIIPTYTGIHYGFAFFVSTAFLYPVISWAAIAIASGTIGLWAISQGVSLILPRKFQMEKWSLTVNLGSTDSSSP